MTASKRLVAGLALALLTRAAGAQAAGEPPVRGEGTAQPYLKALHAKIHRAWVDNFLAMSAAQLNREHPVNTPSRAVVVEAVLAADGRKVAVEVVEPSGAPEFDAAAVEVVKDGAPYPAAPEELLSDDGKAHVTWTFARDERQCSGLAIVDRKGPLAEAVPRLVAQGRAKLAIERLQAADEASRHKVFASFARAWLDRAEEDRQLAILVAAARAAAGDGRGVERLRRAVLEGKEVEVAARALARLAVPLCPLVKDRLEGAATPGRVAALAALRSGVEPECVPALLSLARDRAVAVALRVAAIQILDGVDSDETRQELEGLAKDPQPAVRGAALVAGTRRGAGRPAVIRLTALLRDPAIEVRAGASAALLRAGGEPGVSQLFKLYKEKDARPYEAVARELARMSGPESADMLGKIARGKRARAIRLAAASALAARSDEAARKAQAALAGDPDPEVRFVASAALEPDQRTPAAAAPEGHAWTRSFAALAAGPGHAAATDWVLAHFAKLNPPVRVSVMAEWLAGAIRPAAPAE